MSDSKPKGAARKLGRSKRRDPKGERQRARTARNKALRIAREERKAGRRLLHPNTNPDTLAVLNWPGFAKEFRPA